MLGNKIRGAAEIRTVWCSMPRPIFVIVTKSIFMAFTANVNVRR